MTELKQDTHLEPFQDLCKSYSYGYSEMRDLAENARVHTATVNKMYLRSLVRREDAVKVLEAISERTGVAYTLENVDVAVIPTFAELHEQYLFDIEAIADEAHVSLAIVDMMLKGEKVARKAAYHVLRAASEQAHTQLTLENVDVAQLDS